MAEIKKVKDKISDQQAQPKELEQKHKKDENKEIVDIVWGMSISLEELLLVLGVLTVGGAGWYFKIYQPKQQQVVESDQDFDVDQEYDEDYSGGAIASRLASRPQGRRNREDICRNTGDDV